MIHFVHDPEDGSPIQAGVALEGVGYFPHSRLLIRARTRVVAANIGRSTIALEIGGVPTGVTFPFVATEVGEVLTPTFGIDVTVPPATPIRLVCVEGALSDVLVVVEDGPFATRILPESKFTVQWVDGEERYVVAEYDPATRQFQPTVFAIGRITVVNSPSFALAFGASGPVLRASDGALAAPKFNCSGGTGTKVSPRAEFWIERTRVMSVLASGEVLAAMMEEAVPVVASDRFVLNHNSMPFATVGPLRLIAPQFVEP